MPSRRYGSSSIEMPKKMEEIENYTPKRASTKKKKELLVKLEFAAKVYILIQTTNMEPAACSIQLGLLSQEQINEIQKVDTISRCYFFNDSFSFESAIKRERVLLELRGEYLVQVDLYSQAIISGFRCDYSINFEIGRSSPIAPSSLGQPETIQFSLNSQVDSIISLRAEDPRQLDQFAKKLQKKYIVQKGFHQSFKAVKILGRGLTATVYKAISFRDQKQVAIKSFKRAVYFQTTNGKQSFQKQFKILTLVQHKNLCALESVYESPNTTYIVMQNLALSLFGWIQKYGFPSLHDGKKMMYQLLSGIDYLHSKKIMHRDLKLENIMVRKDSKENVQIVIVDLGLAEYTYSTNFLYTRCGTPGYVAPQILRHKIESQKYNEACDIFSLGVIFHILSFKRSLFEGSEVKQVIKKNTQCIIDFNTQYFNNLPNDGLDLLKKMLEKDPSKRITAYEALNHEYLKSVTLSQFPYKIGCTIESIKNIV